MKAEVATDKLAGVKFVRLHYRGKIEPIIRLTYAWEIEKGYEFDTGHLIGSRTYDWKLDYMAPEKRKAFLEEFQKECDKRGWKAFRVADRVEVYTDF